MPEDPIHLLLQEPTSDSEEKVREELWEQAGTFLDGDPETPFETGFQAWFARVQKDKAFPLEKLREEMTDHGLSIAARGLYFDSSLGTLILLEQGIFEEKDED